MTRELRNYLGEVVGTLTLPDDTPDEIWVLALAPYLRDPNEAEDACLE